MPASTRLAHNTWRRRIASGLHYTALSLRHALAWSWRELGYWFTLFLYTTRQCIRVEAVLAPPAALAYFGVILLREDTLLYQQLLDHCYLFFSIVMVVLCMNLLPRERDEETLEILWSQPMSRAALIILQLFTLTFWVFVLAAAAIAFFSYFSIYSEDPTHLLLLLFTTLFAVGALTLLVSTFCRQGLATGMVSLLLLGVHYFWLKQLGPIEFFYNPIPSPEAEWGRINAFDFWFNRGILLLVIGFILDYLFLRLKRTAEWFT